MNESRIEKNKEISKTIEKEEREEKIKKITKITLLIIVPIILFMFISYFTLKVIGNLGIVVREYPVYKNTLPNNFEGFKIIEFSDIHYNQNYSLSKIKDIVNLINKANPDIVIFAGDLIDKDYILDDQTKEQIMIEFNKINAKIAKYAIYGDEDSNYFKEIFDNSNFIILSNTLEKIYLNDNYIDIISLDETYSKNNVLGVLENDYKIILTHKPDLADRIINDFKPELILSAHSHNGQVRLPLIGPLMKKIGSKKYISSHYTINDTDLYISGGLGNSKYDFRLFNHPSINFFRLKINK